MPPPRLSSSSSLPLSPPPLRHQPISSSAAAMRLEPPNQRDYGHMYESLLLSPEDLIPLHQSLITPDLALAFDIPTANSAPSASAPPPPNRLDFESPAPSPPDEQNRTLKRPRLVWTPQLHKRFVDAVAHLGIKNAVPKTIMQLMSVDGLTRENVASHLQKYRLYLKRMQGSAGAPMAQADAATDHLFATVPHPFHNRGAAGGVPFLQVGAVPPYYHQHQHSLALDFPPFSGRLQHPGVIGLRPRVEVEEKKALTLFPSNGE